MTLRVARHFVFGSEDGDIEPFHNTLDLLDNNSEEYNQAIKNAMQEGLSYPMALNKAYDAVQPNTEKGGRLVDLSKPNNILGFHYMQAARTLNSSMMPTTIKRLGAEYHDDTLEVNKVASATGIRKSFFSTEKLDEVLNFIPESTKNILIEWQTERMNFGNWESFYPFLRFSILRDGPAHLSTIADLSEGIENLIYRAAKKNDTFQTFMNDIKSKRYTWTRIQRMLTHILTGFTKEMRSEIDVPAYLRLLGMTDKGRSYLSGRKKDLPLPLISKVAAFSNPSLDMDIQASDIYALAIGKGSIASKIGLDYTISPIMNNYFSGSPLK
ncbi:nucleotidyltransferase family protein [Sporosarcina thermotolerans]|uniref:tRNA(Met) cytidine acetate ligase n=1 Tax=Sporosarcina thermotolerans TaxID=633404 RepID=UPI0024BD0AEA|nr:nucleotidyltransferase family protein [Sporosarcina thermotolerans]WHT46934.1 nucleotidyltransferase family protein [Sporosarcina thermotolerans]